VRAFNHLLGESGVILFGAAGLVAKYRTGFPQSLDGAPFLLPTSNTTARRSLDQWFEARHIRPAIVAEFEDSALLQVFGQRGLGLFVAHSLISVEIQRQYGVKVVGQLDGVTERFYAVSLDRKLKHPAVVAISEAARARLAG
jgi:LysR family transcriptional activator of nhaA